MTKICFICVLKQYKMKNLLILIVAFVSFIGYSQEKVISLEKAKEMASSESKNIVLIFSGSDWCAPCIKLDRSIIQSDEFKKATKTNWILVKADFPKKKANALSDEQTKANQKLAEKYNPEGSFPKVLLLNPKGEVLGILGYEKSSPDVYIEKLKSFVN